jgi:bacterioferritin-associated ferredoxin
MYICLCRGLTETDVELAGRSGHTSAERLVVALRLDDPRCCGRCRRDIDDLVDLAERAAKSGPLALSQASHPGAQLQRAGALS